jgi:hypothetical protein
LIALGLSQRLERIDEAHQDEEERHKGLTLHKEAQDWPLK